MTENEAKTNLELVTNKWESDEEMFSDSMDIIIDQEFVDTLYIAIKALRELPQYRAIGTVEELEAASKYLRLVKMCGTVGKVIEGCAEYEEIGTPKECRAAVAKQKAQTPDFEGDGYSDGQIVYDTWICPGCGKDYEIDYDKHEYCPNCGQKISWDDWEDE